MWHSIAQEEIKLIYFPNKRNGTLAESLELNGHITVCLILFRLTLYINNVKTINTKHKHSG